MARTDAVACAMNVGTADTGTAVSEVRPTPAFLWLPTRYERQPHCLALGFAGGENRIADQSLLERTLPAPPASQQ